MLGGQHSSVVSSAPTILQRRVQFLSFFWWRHIIFLPNEELRLTWNEIVIIIFTICKLCCLSLFIFAIYNLPFNLVIFFTIGRFAILLLSSFVILLLSSFAIFFFGFIGNLFGQKYRAQKVQKSQCCCTFVSQSEWRC